jgi:hypothetical protein
MGKKKPLGPRNKIVTNVLNTFGGLDKISAICTVGKSAVCQWRETVPYKHQQKSLAYARKHGIRFVAEDFFTLRPEDTVSSSNAGPPKRVVESREFIDVLTNS